MQRDFPHHQRYRQYDHNGRHEPVLFGDGWHPENERGQRRHQRRCRQQLRHLGHKGLAGGWRHCRHSGSGRRSSLGCDSGGRCCYWTAAGHGWQGHRSMAPSRTAFNSIARNIGGSMGVNTSWGTSHSAPSRPALRTAPPMGRRMEHRTPSASRRATAQQTPAAWAVPSRSSCATNRWRNCWNALKISSSAPRRARITAVINVRLISFRLPRPRRYLRPILTVH